MPRAIDYYFTVASPWSYLGHALLHDMCARHGAALRYRPIPIAEVFQATGGLPRAKRPPARQRYRFVELQRWRGKRGLPLVLEPTHSPIDPQLLDRAIAALADAGRDPSRLAGDALAALWAEDRDINDPVVAADIMRSAGFDPAEVLALARTERAAALYARNGADAVAADVFGAPAYVLDGEVFWGQDRLELLDDALASGRAPFRPMPVPEPLQ